MRTREVRPLRRLYSTFAAVGRNRLILMRIVVGFALVSSAGPSLLSSRVMPLTILCVLLAAAAVLLIIGLFTPIVGTLVALIESFRLILVNADRLLYLLIATFGAALAMLGPGLWSLDARLFGWKRIEPHLARGSSRTRKNPADPLKQGCLLRELEASVCLHIARRLPRCRVSRNGNRSQNVFHQELSRVLRME